MMEVLTLFFHLQISSQTLAQTTPQPPASPPAKSATDPARKALHLLNRLSYGPRPGELETLTKAGDAGIEKWLAEQLQPETLDDAIVGKKVKAYKALSMSIGELHKAFPKNTKTQDSSDMDDDSPRRRMLIELGSQRLIRAAESKRQLQEVLLNFWFNHFNVDFRKGQVKYYLIAYERDTLRPRIFGKFRELLGAVVKSPAMLVYLDNFQSVREGFIRRKVDGTIKARGLNENYGRELLELHTLGVDGGYTQKDVRETARALTGWSLIELQKATEFRFQAKAHDSDEKQILGLTLPKGGGIEDGEKVLDMLARHPATARFLAKKLAIKFIADNPPESAIAKLALTFQKTDGDLRAVYKELFHLPEFWATEAERAKIKTPWEFEVSAIRALGGMTEIPARGPLRVFQALKQMGEPLYLCQPPTGFKATADHWVNPGALVTRINFGLALADNRVPEIDVDTIYFRKRLEAEDAYTVESSLNRLNQWILAGGIRQETRDRLVAELDADEKVINDNTPPTRDATINLAKLLGLVIGSPEFQRR